MKWPYNRRADAAHTWGTLTAGIAIVGIIVGALAVTHANDKHFHWWWPTNWLIIPIGIIAIGLIMLVVPFRRLVDQSDEGPKSSQGSPPVPKPFEQNINANAPGSMAQGAAFGNVINYPRQASDGPPDPAGAESSGEQP